MGRKGSRVAGGAVTAAVALAIAAFWAGVAALLWQALKPYRVAAAELWQLVPAGYRDHAGPAAAIAGGVLLALFVVAGIAAKDHPARPRRTSRAPRIGVDTDVDDTDV